MPMTIKIQAYSVRDGLLFSSDEREFSVKHDVVDDQAVCRVVREAVKQLKERRGAADHLVNCHCSACRKLRESIKARTGGGEAA